MPPDNHKNALIIGTRLANIQLLGEVQTPLRDFHQSSRRPILETSSAKMGIHQDPPSASQPESQPKMPLTSATDPYEVFRNLDGATPLELGPDAKYTVGEHILWAPRKVRVASIGAGASGIMLCYKKEKEFGDDIDLVVYERMYAAVRWTAASTFLVHPALY